MLKHYPLKTREGYRFEAAVGGYGGGPLAFVVVEGLDASSHLLAAGL